MSVPYLKKTRLAFAATLAACSVVSLSLSVTSCGSSSSSGSNDSGEKVIAVTGTLSDWDGKSEPFKDYVFMLVDAEDQRVYRTTVGEGGRLTVSSVPSSRKYYGVMLNTEYKFGWLMQFAATVEEKNRNFQVFSFNGTGSLGALFPEGRLLIASLTDSLKPLTDFAFRDENKNGIPDGLESDVANNENASAKNTEGDLEKDKILDTVDSDLDNDGIADVFDNDVDNNGTDDLFDTDINHDGVDDQQKSFRAPSTLGIGYRQVFHEIVTNDDDTQSTNLWFILESKNKAKSVSVASGSYLNEAIYSGGDTFDGKLFDNGSHGDGLPDDGIWTASVTLAKTKTFTSDQVVIFKVTAADDKVYEFPYKLPSKLSGSVTMDTCAKEESNLKLSFTIGETLTKYPGLSLQTLVSDATGKRIYSSVRMPISATSDLVPLTNFASGKKYFCTVRVLAPSAIPGYPGSSLRAKAVTFDAP